MPAHAQASAPNQPLSLQNYLTQLRVASDVLNGSANTPAFIHNFRVTLPSEWVVEMNGQSSQTMHIKTDWLASALAIEEAASPDDAARLEPARQRLAALREAAEALAAPPPDAAPQAQPRAKLDRILSDREFRGARGPSWWDKLKARIFAWITKYLDKLFGKVGISASTGSGIAWAVVILVALLMAYWGRPLLDQRHVTR